MSKSVQIYWNDDGGDLCSKCAHSFSFVVRQFSGPSIGYICWLNCNDNDCDECPNFQSSEEEELEYFDEV